MKETFGEYIRILRNSKNFTLTQLGAMLGLDSGALSKIETNQRTLKEKYLPKLAEIFELDKERLADEYYSEHFAKVMYKQQCSEKALLLAEEKLKYIRNKNTKQGNLKF